MQDEKDTRNLALHANFDWVHPSIQRHDGCWFMSVTLEYFYWKLQVPKAA